MDFLNEMRHIFDYNQLTNLEISNPTKEYRMALSEFISENLWPYVQNENYDIIHFTIKSLLIKTGWIKDAIKVREVSLTAVRSCYQFYDLARLEISNPTNEYRIALSQFVQRYHHIYCQ